MSFNQERFIEAAVRSAFLQTGCQLDILLSDDCSTDGTFRVMEELAAAYSGPHAVRAVQTPTNLGMIRHVGRCFAMADTDWIIAAAGDDVSRPDRASSVLRAVDSFPQVAGVHSSWLCMDEGGCRMRPRLGQRLARWLGPRTDRASVQGRALGFLSADEGKVHGATASWRRSLWLDFPEVDPGCAEDLVLSFRAAFRGGTAFLRDTLVDYRVHSSNLWPKLDSAPDLMAQQLRRKMTMIEASCRQHEVDLDYLVGRGEIDPAAAMVVRHAIHARRLCWELSLSVDARSARIVRRALVNTALALEAGGPSESLLPRKVHGWVQLAFRDAVSRLLARSARLR